MTFSCKLEPKFRLRKGVIVSVEASSWVKGQWQKNKGSSVNFREGNISFMQVEAVLYMEHSLPQRGGRQAGSRAPGCRGWGWGECSPWCCSWSQGQVSGPHRGWREVPPALGPIWPVLWASSRSHHLRQCLGSLGVGMNNGVLRNHHPFCDHPMC